jgi:ubiquinone/menaquinone biosynthesis C-methylase UbiE
MFGPNKRYQKLYDKIAFLYDFQYWLWAGLLRGGEAAVRKEYLNDLEIRPNDKVLEISVGTGSDLRFLSSEAQYVGLDISLGMLRKGRSNLKRWRRSADLICGEAETLPFNDGLFDVVFLVAGINFFNDKLAAIREMIRVAKAGTQIVIVDGTDKLNTSYGKLPLARRFVERQRGMMNPPIDLIPDEMCNVELKHVCQGDFYSLSFRTPPETSRRAGGGDSGRVAQHIA